MKDFYLFGKGELAIYCAEKYLSRYDKNNLKIIPVVPEPSWSNSLIEWSKKNKVEVIEYEKIMNFNIAQGSIGLSVYFDKIFKLSLIEKFYRLCNIHNSPLSNNSLKSLIFKKFLLFPELYSKPLTTFVPTSPILFGVKLLSLLWNLIVGIITK